MLNLLFGVGFGFGAALVGFGMYYKLLVHVPEQRLVKPVEAADCDFWEEQVDALKECLQKQGAELQAAQRENQALKTRLAQLEAWIENALKMPSYARSAKVHDREVLACKLYYVEKWSKRRIVKHLWGGAGGNQYKNLAKILSASSVTESV